MVLQNTKHASSIRLEVRMLEETVWLTQAQMGQLFGCSTDNVGLHLKNLYTEGEIDFEATTEEISVYRVSSQKATRFRQWANTVLKDYLLRGYVISQRVERLEQRVAKTEEQIGFFVRKQGRRLGGAGLCGCTYRR